LRAIEPIEKQGEHDLSGGLSSSVSVVVPTRGRPIQARRAVESVLCQDHPGLVECHVVFDSSRPPEFEVDCPPRREVRLLENDRTPGPAGARNAGAARATGDLLAFCDDDDVWHPTKLRRQVAALTRVPEANVATCGLMIDTGRRSFRRVPAGDRICLPDLVAGRRMETHTSTLVVRRDFFWGVVGPFDEAMPGSYAEDYEWLLRAVRSGPIVAVPEPLVRIEWKGSWFAEGWSVIIPALHYLLDRHPEIRTSRRNLSRIYGRLAFAHAACGDTRSARSWARRSIQLDWRQYRGYAAMLATYGFLSPNRVVQLAHRMGKGV
jgi:glycosyltransferase involved in cell wall biosynthesis